MNRRWFFLLLGVALLLAGTLPGRQSQAGVPAGSWQVHDPIVYSNLALFPVTASVAHDSSPYITLDEGLRTGEVEVMELGPGLIRHRPGTTPSGGSPQVNTLALVNHSKKALILLAGEIVTGGRQDRVISKDRVVPPGADPLPLDVFCVEPGRWQGASQAFRGQSFMAAPSVREKAAVAKNQQEVWDATAAARENLAGAAGLPAAAPELRSSSSYAQVERSGALKAKIDEASSDLQRDYERALADALRGKNVVGVVVAVNGEVVWADLFSDAALFERYWPKLLRSYVVEALSVPVIEHARASVTAAESFLAQREGRQIIEVEPGEYRLVQIDHPRYSIFQLASLWEKNEPLLHFNKLRKERVEPRPRPVPMPIERQR